MSHPPDSRFTEHTRTSISDEIIAAALARFADQYLLGHDRAAMLEIQLPAGAAEVAAQRDRRAAALCKKLAKIETAQIEQLGDDTSPGKRALRDRTSEQNEQRHSEHAALTAELDILTTPASDDADAGDPSLLDELPYAPGLLSQAPSASGQVWWPGRSRARGGSSRKDGFRPGWPAQMTRSRPPEPAAPR